MKRKILFAVLCSCIAVSTTSLADFYITAPSTGERLLKWDGQYLIKPGTGERLCKWDGTYVTKPGTGERLFKYDGSYLTKPGTGERLTKIDGSIPIAIIVALATGTL